MQNVALRFAQVKSVDQNIIHVFFHDMSEIGEQEAQELKGEVLKLAESRDFALIIDSGTRRIDISHEAREFLASDPEFSRQMICQAHVATSISNKLIFHFLINFHKPDFPVQVFDSLPEALSWIGKWPIANF